MRVLIVLAAVAIMALMFGRTAHGQVFVRGNCPGGVCPAPMPKANGPSKAEPPAIVYSVTRASEPAPLLRVRFAAYRVLFHRPLVRTFFRPLRLFR